MSRFFNMGPARRRGLGAIEVITISAIVGFLFLFLMMALPRWRETSRMVTCQRNLMQVGLALEQYNTAQRHYPGVGLSGDSVVKAMLDDLVLPDLLGFKEPGKKVPALNRPVVGLRIPGIGCPTDAQAMAGVYPTAISYRANTGDTSTGLGGPFAIGRVTTPGDVEAGDGLSFTAGFAERLVGDGQIGHVAPRNYADSTEPVSDAGCGNPPSGRWRGDAGMAWSESSWRSTLYNHAIPPNSPNSCIAEDGRTGTMGASSEHDNRVNVLMLDGSVRGVTRSVSPEIWKAMGSTSSTPGPTK